MSMIDFKKWHKNNLVEFLDFLERRYPTVLMRMLADYDECMRGD